MVDRHAAVFPLAHQSFAFIRSAISLPRPQLQIATVMPNHPVVADRPLSLYSKDLPQFPCLGLASMIVFRLNCSLRKTPVVFGQILLFQILIGRRVTGNPFPPQLLDQPVLMHAMAALHSPFVLRCTGCDDPYP